MTTDTSAGRAPSAGARLAWAAALMLAACSDATPAGTVERLESGRVVVHNAPDAPTWTLRERFRLGSLDDTGPALFAEIRDVDLDADGNLYVLDGQPGEVRMFDPDGAYVRTLGRPGRGPGELSNPGGMAIDRDGRLWVANLGNARYTGFDPGTGEVVAEPRRQAGFGILPWPGRFDAEGHLTEVVLLESGPGMVRLDTAFAPVDSLPMPMPDEDDVIEFRRGDLRVASIPDPFSPMPRWAFSPVDGVVIGEGAEYRIHRVRFSGDTTMSMEVDRAPVPVSAEERDSVLATFDEMVDRIGQPPSRRPRVRDVKPAHGFLFVDDADRVWVQRAGTPGEPGRWDVLAADGRLVGTVVEPGPAFVGAVLPSVVAGRMAVPSFPDGIPTVVVYDIVEGDP